MGAGRGLAAQRSPKPRKIPLDAVGPRPPLKPPRHRKKGYPRWQDGQHGGEGRKRRKRANCRQHAAPPKGEKHDAFKRMAKGKRQRKEAVFGYASPSKPRDQRRKGFLFPLIVEDGQKGLGLRRAKNRATILARKGARNEEPCSFHKPMQLCPVEPRRRICPRRRIKGERRNRRRKHKERCPR